MKKKHWHKVRYSTEIIELTMYLHGEVMQNPSVTRQWQFLVKGKTHSHIVMDDTVERLLMHRTFV